MKITVNKKETEQNIDWRGLPTGTVVEHRDGVVSLVYSGKGTKQLFLLNYTGGATWLGGRAAGYRTIPVVKVLGVIKEIVVE